MSVRLRRTVHRGSVFAEGFLFDLRWLGEEVARERVLGLAASAAEVYRGPHFLVLRLCAPRRVDCARALGAPLVAQGSLLSPAPLTALERAQLERPEMILVLVAGGVARAVALSELSREDPAAWLDVSAFEVLLSSSPPGEVFRAPRATAEHAPIDLKRALLAPIPGKSPDRADAATSVSAERAFWSPFARALAAAGPSPGARWKALFRAFWTRLLLASGLVRLFGRQHARLFARMMELFDSEQLDEALRYAIPLADAVRPTSQVASPGWRLFRRSSFEISPPLAEAAHTIGLPTHAYEDLRRRYRAIFERLVARGDVDKAAFVLAELLGAHEEAVSFLERHGRLRLAAEIAEARKLPPGLVVRQWFLAGDLTRALDVARRTGAFPDAIVRLERSHPAQARALRLLWGDLLATSGAYAAAVEAVWPVEHARHLVARWIDDALELGGPQGAQMLVRKLRLAPESAPEIRARAIALLEDDHDDDARMARAFGRELLAGPATEEIKRLARRAARRLLSDTNDKGPRRLALELVELSGDPILRADASPRLNAPAKNDRVSIDAFGRGSNHPHPNVDCFVWEANRTISAEATRVLTGHAEAKVFGLIQFDERWGSDEPPEPRPRRRLRDVLEASLAEHGCESPKALLRVLAATNARLLPGTLACEITLASVFGTELFFAHVGSHRGYVLRSGVLFPITRDHTLQEQVSTWGPSPGHADFSMVATRCLGAWMEVEVDLFRVSLIADDVVLISSPHLHGALPLRKLQETIRVRARPSTSVEALLEQYGAAREKAPAAAIVARFYGSALPAPSPQHLPPSVEFEACDLHELAPPRLASSRVEVTRISRAATDRGHLPVFDAVELPDGKVLVALGELGAWMMSRDGKVVAQFAEPAHRLVVSEHGNRAIALAPRGGSQRLARLDLLRRTAMPWCEVVLGAFAPEFDGATWFVARGDTAYAIDAAAREWTSFWSVREANAVIGAMRRETGGLCIWFEKRDLAFEGEIWHFELPSLTLRQRRRVVRVEGEFVGSGLSPTGLLAAWTVGEEARSAGSVWGNAGWSPVELSSPVSSPPHVSEGAVVFFTAGDEGAIVQVADTKTLELRFQIELGGARLAGARVQGEHLVCFDDTGRVLVVSLATRRVLREFRIHAVS